MKEISLCGLTSRTPYVLSDGPNCKEYNLHAIPISCIMRRKLHLLHEIQFLESSFEFLKVTENDMHFSCYKNFEFSSSFERVFIWFLICKRFIIYIHFELCVQFQARLLKFIKAKKHSFNRKFCFMQMRKKGIFPWF